MISITANCCPKCKSKRTRKGSSYKTKTNGTRKRFICKDCGKHYTETTNTPAFRLRTPLSKVSKVLQARSEGMAANATCRLFGISKRSLIAWEKLFAELKKPLMLYSLCNTFLTQLIEGDELYTKVNKNMNPKDSKGWTVVLMERVSRFIWYMGCGKHDRKLFKKAIQALATVIDRTDDLSLFTDGERRYGALLFDLCYEIIRNGKRGRPKKTLAKGVKCAIKNKGSKKGPGRKRKKYETPWILHPDTDSQINNSEIQANRLEATNASFRRKNSAFRRRTNTYAKDQKSLQRTIDVSWVIRNFTTEHFSTGVVPAVAQGIIEEKLEIQSLFALRFCA